MQKNCVFFANKNKSKIFFVLENSRFPPPRKCSGTRTRRVRGGARRPGAPGRRGFRCAGAPRRRGLEYIKEVALLRIYSGSGHVSALFRCHAASVTFPNMDKKGGRRSDVNRRRFRKVTGFHRNLYIALKRRASYFRGLRTAWFGGQEAKNVACSGTERRAGNDSALD